MFPVGGCTRILRKTKIKKNPRYNLPLMSKKSSIATVSRRILADDVDMKRELWNVG